MPIRSLHLSPCALSHRLNNKLLGLLLTPLSPITLHTFHYLGDQAERDVWGRSDHYHHLFPLVSLLSTVLETDI